MCIYIYIYICSDKDDLTHMMSNDPGSGSTFSCEKCCLCDGLEAGASCARRFRDRVFEFSRFVYAFACTRQSRKKLIRTPRIVKLTLLMMLGISEFTFCLRTLLWLPAP